MHRITTLREFIAYLEQQGGGSTTAARELDACFAREDLDARVQVVSIRSLGASGTSRDAAGDNRLYHTRWAIRGPRPQRGGTLANGILIPWEHGFELTYTS
jgi:hypothetical protein